MKKILNFLKKLFKGIGIFLLILISGYLILLWRSHRLDTYFIKNAEFRYPPDTQLLERFTDELPMGRPQFQVHLHRLKAGSGVIFAVREYRGIPLLIDAEGFMKLTIWIQELKPGTYDFKNREQIRGYYTAGGAAWPDATCSANIENGSMEVQANSESDIKIKINSVLDCKRRGATSGRNVILSESYKLSEMDSKDVYPWIGAIGAHIYDETYPRTKAEHIEIEEKSNDIAKEFLKENKTKFPLSKVDALKLAEAKLIEVYGNAVLKQKPFQILMDDEIWIITGSQHCLENQICEGGVAKIQIAAKDGSVISVTEEK